MVQTDQSADAPPQTLPTSFVLRSFDGLKNTLQPERLGVRDLVRGRNIVLDDSGQPSRRRGYTQKIVGNVHSLFTSYQGVVLAVVDAQLGILNPDYSFDVLETGIGADPSRGTPPLAYAQVGDLVYYSGPADRGMVNIPERSWSSWGNPTDLWLSPVVNPTATLPPVAGRLLKQPPNATCLTYFNGRIYLGQGMTMWATDLFLYDYVDATAGFKAFEADITMIGAVADGIYVGTAEGLWFLSGPTFAEMRRVRVMDSGVIPGSMVDIPGELGNPPQVPIAATTPVEVSIMFMTTKGVCIGLDSGRTLNMTEGKFVFPDAVGAAALYRRQDGVNQYISTLQNGGTPTQASAIGDYLDVTIIRGSSRPFPPPGPLKPGPHKLFGVLVAAQGRQVLVAAGMVVTISGPVQADQVLVAAGAVVVAGVLAAPQVSETLAAAGAVIGAVGTLAATQADETLATAGGPVVAGALTATQGDQTLPGNSALIIAQAAETLAAAGTVAVAGALTASQAETLAAAGTVTVAGALAASQGSETLAAIGTVFVAGALAVPQASEVLVAAGMVTGVAGALTATQGNHALVAAGTVAGLAGALDIAQTSQTLAATGSVVAGGALAIAQANETLAAVGKVVVAGTLTVAQDSQTLAVACVGALAAVQASEALAAAGRVAVTGTLMATQGSQTLVAAAGGPVTGALAVTQDDQALGTNNMILIGQTTGSAGVTLTLDGGAPSALNQLVLADNQIIFADIYVMGKVAGAGDALSSRFEVVIRRGTGAASTTIVPNAAISLDGGAEVDPGPVAAVLALSTFATPGAASWTVTPVADTTHGALSVVVTGSPATNVSWAAEVDLRSLVF